MENIKVTVLGETIEVPKGTTIQKIADKYEHRFPTPIMIAKIGAVMKELRYSLKKDTSLTLIDLSSPDGLRVYQRSVSFLMVVAACDVLGKDTNINICHSIKKNFFCEIDGYIPTEQDLKNIEKRMMELVEADLPFEKKRYHLEDAIELISKSGQKDKADLFKFRSVSTANLYKLGEVYDYFYSYMATSTRHLKLFRLLKAEDGFFLMFPSQNNPTKLADYEPVDNISEVFKEYSNIGNILNISTASNLNILITKNKIPEIIRTCEALQEKKIAQIADMVLNRGEVKLILIAGPSSSGKTTFAHRLGSQLRINGIVPHMISLDNYFRNRDEAPLDENGNPNFEALEFLNIELFNQNLQKLLKGEEIQPPFYNFVTGKSGLGDEQVSLKENEIIIAEGIHGLNEKLTSSIPKNKKFKIFISALTNLNIDSHNRISTSDSRLIRRLVRDNMTRGASAERTIGMWQSVLKGEATYIFPTQKEADVVFNSSLMYELSVLKQFAEPLLFGVGVTEPSYSECKRLIKFLSWFLGSPTEDIPKNSIIREFIGGSCFPV